MAINTTVQDVLKTMEKEGNSTKAQNLMSEAVDKTGVNADIAKYNSAIDAVGEEMNTTTQHAIAMQQAYAAQQQALQQQKTDQAISVINQQKEQTKKDYLKEQSGAYVDWQKESNKYGANAEQMATSGLENTGYSESSQVSLYNTYQNRVATARDSYNRAILNYDNAIKDAQLQNSSVLAEIAYSAMQSQLELTLQNLQYQNQLLLDKVNKEFEIENTYWSRYMDEQNLDMQRQSLALQNKQFKENKRQYNKNYNYQKEQDKLNYELQLMKLNASSSSGSSGGRSSGGSGGNKAVTYSGGNNTQQIPQDNPKNDGKNKLGKNTYSTEYIKDSEYNGDCAIYGVFDNGYQPKGISGYGELTKSGTAKVRKTTLAGESKIATQNVWKAEDGTYWIWDSGNNAYRRYWGLTTQSNNSNKTTNNNANAKHRSMGLSR